MGSFKKLNTKIYEKADHVVTPDSIYWKKLGVPVLVKEFGPIDCIDFSPVEPFYFAVTCSVRVQVYNPITKLVVKNLSRFRQNAYGAVFRHDGKLLSVGGDEGVIKLFDVSSKSLLRLFKGHEAPVHRTYFIRNRPQIASFSDDRRVKVWDIPTEKDVITYGEHTDYVRAGATNPILPDIILSGSYDSTVKMYDTRTKEVVLNVNHGSPVESLLYLPSGGIFLSAGGTQIKIWDTFAGGKLLGCVSQHHKTITCLRLASDGKRLLSGSLDRHVKIYDVGTFKVVHTLNYSNAVLSLSVSKNDDTVAVGMADGLVAISRREDEKIKSKEKTKASHKYVSRIHHNTVDAVVPAENKQMLSKHDVYLRKFQYSKALDCVLLPYVATKSPHVTVSVLQELMRRKALARVLQNRDTKSLMQILRFFSRNIADYRFTKVLIVAVHVFIEVYEETLHLMPIEVIQVFYFLAELLKRELELADELCKLQGAMQMLLSAADVTDETGRDESAPNNLKPSADAQKNFVIDIP